MRQILDRFVHLVRHKNGVLLELEKFTKQNKIFRFYLFNLSISSLIHFGYLQGVPINMGIKRRIRNLLCKELWLDSLISLVKIKLRLIEHILFKL